MMGPIQADEETGADRASCYSPRGRTLSSFPGGAFPFLLLMMILGACTGSVQASITPTALELEPGKGEIRGRLETLPQVWQGMEVYAYAAPYLGPPDGEGIFVLDAALHPKGQVDMNGLFQIGPVEPGEYVLVFGPNPEAGVAFRQGLKAAKYRVEADQVVDVGSLTLAP